MPVLRQSFSISRPAGNDLPIAGPLICHDAGRYFTFFLDDEGLVIRSKGNARLPCQCILYFNQDLPDATRAALEVLSHSREDSTQEGALTVLTTICIDREDTTNYLRFILDVNFNTALYTLRNKKQRALSQYIMTVLGTHKPDQPPVEGSITAHSFYKAAFVPDRDTFVSLDNVQIPGLATKLYPFQRRALQWLLMREHVMYDSTSPDGEIQLAAYPQPPSSTLPLSFATRKDVNGEVFYVSDLFHIATRNIAAFQETENSLRGGILAEEMGLGKTVEIISLILTHKRKGYDSAKMEVYVDGVVQPTGATLIVTPDTLQSQWLSEFEKHAPDLFVTKYPGMKAWSKGNILNTESKGESPLSQFTSKLANSDVVITTYSVLQSELHYAMAPPQRSMRYEKQHERQTSPLVKVGWWRVCLDEAQQIDSGVSSAAKVAQLIPRVNAWAVTGTPIKNNPNDLWGLLLFLGYEPFASYPVIWKALLSTHQDLFRHLFNRITIRHRKQAVRDELKLPSQRRYAVKLPFTAIEEHHYQSQLQALVEKAGLDEQGTPLSEDWDPSDPLVVQSMKRALASLRQTILHPELGSVGLKAVAYKTLAEHLETMIDHLEAKIRSDQRICLGHKVKRGQLLENSPRVKEALTIWEEVLTEIEPSILEAREELRKAREEFQKARESADQKRRHDVGMPSDEEPTDMETLETAKISKCSRKLRLYLDLQHQATFFIANALFQIKSDSSLTEPDSDDYRRLEQREVEGYELARKIRREILQEPLSKVSKLMEKLRGRAITQSFVEIPEVIMPDLHGIESEQTATKLGILGDFLNGQAEVIDDWREHVIQLLLKPLVDTEDEEDLTGEEYEDSKKVQDYLMVYTSELRAIISDRQEALTGLVNERIRKETAAVERQAKEGEGLHAPEKLLELRDIRISTNPPPTGCSLRGMIAALRELSAKLRYDASAGSNRARVELEIVSRHLSATQSILSKQSKAAAALERDFEFFTSIMNARITFYRQLQSVSDNVAPLEDGLVADAVTSWNRYRAQEISIIRQVDYCKSDLQRRTFASEAVYC